MTDRLALLIGVPSCNNEMFEPLGHIVETDIARMRNALQASRYQIRYCGGGDSDGQTPSLGTIKQAILRALGAVAEGGTLLIYFSGHGVSLDGTAYLVPQDPIVHNDEIFPDSLMPVSLHNLVGSCRARLVILVADACRDDPTRSSTVPRASLPILVNGDFVLISSCSPGQVSAYNDSGSAFTKAFAEALGPQHPARTIRSVFDTVVRRLAATGSHEEDERQEPQLIAAGHGSIDDLVICESDQVSGQWRDAVLNTSIWQRVADEHGREQARDLVLTVTESSAETWLAAHGRFADAMGFADPWAAHEHPVRLLARAEQCLPPDLPLKAIEAALMVAAPFIREIAQSVGLERSTEVKPTDFKRTFELTPRYDLEITHHMYEHVCRRAEGLGKRGYTEYRDTLAMWLVHRWLTSRAALWEEPAVKLACRETAAAVHPLTRYTYTEDELAGILMVLARCCGAEADDQALVERLGRHDFTPDTRLLAGALWLGGLMANDPRRVPSVVVDHLGVGVTLNVAAVHQMIGEADWRSIDGVLTLNGVCHHPALHDALVDVTKRTGFARTESITKLAGAERLPTRFSPIGIRPATSGGLDAYQVPLLRFQLSEEKIRELLMGRQLYGEPELAIRELYQNALDACRYRTARREYLDRIGVRLPGWHGKIEFRQGTTPDGRKYIECVDNGVGMNRDTLEKTFANAGERFIYRSSFRSEQSRWQEQDPPIPFVPNSQFGVGVFSYFMLAELIEIKTRPSDQHDSPAQVGYEVRIASSGSLFQITETWDAAPGTQVRLYLTGEDDVSVLRTMRDLLRVAEFDVTVDEEELPSEQWTAEELYYPDAGTQHRKAGDDFWWVAGEGCLVADGIATSEKRHGFMVNLRGRRQPQFTVDRKKLRAWDKDWVNQKIQEALSDLMTWPGLTLSWLWEVAEATPGVANDIFQRLLADGRSLAVEGAVGDGLAPEIRRVGCLPLDQRIVGEGFHYFQDDWMTKWRLGVWKDYLKLPSWYRVAAPRDISGLPLVDPFDAEILSSTRVFTRADRPHWQWQQGCPDRELLLKISSSDETAPAERLRRLRRYAIIGLNLTAARDTPHVEHVLKEEDLPLLPALAAWSPPGSPPREVIGACLANVSQYMHLPLGTVIKRAHKLAPPDWEPPAELPDDLSKATVTSSEALILNHYCPQPNNSGSPIIIGPENLIQIMSTFDLTIAKALQQIDKFSHFGYIVEDRENYPEDLTKIEIEALREKPRTGLLIGVMELVALAANCDTSVADARSGLERIVDSGLVRTLESYPLHIDLPTSREIQVARQSITYTPFGFRRRWTHESHVFTRVVSHVPDMKNEDFEEEVQLLRRILDAAAEGHRVTIEELTYIAFSNAISIGEAFNLLRNIFPEDEDLLADIPVGLQDSNIQCQSWRDGALLLGDPFSMDVSRERMRWQIRAGTIVETALDTDRTLPAVLDRVAKFRVLGAPIPTLDEDQRLAFSSLPVTQHDVEMLSREDELGYKVPVEDVDALYLVQIAGRFGWTVREADIRIRRYGPFGVTLHYDGTACPDRLVHWQDLLAITVHLDGQAPTLQGQVTATHLAEAAAILEETPEDVRDRLRPYGPLIGFTLNEESVVV
ncbi:caspase family protein [Micromonospora haikouensis]|uniref:HD domain-containing protein n=1 Tax=Micromonospora haikouensis TaxID=686309 RepID=UPI003789C836